MNGNFVVYCELKDGQIGFICDYNLDKKTYHTVLDPFFAKVFDVKIIGDIDKMLNWIGVRHYFFQFNP